jgi:hypothetical protein
MKRSEAVKETAQHLFNAEAGIDSAYGLTADLASQLSQIRVKAGLSATVGQDAFDSVTSALAALSTARREIVKAHRELDAVKTRIGCRTVASGGMDKDDSISPANEPVPARSTIAA